MGFTITGNETLLFITTDASKFGFTGRYNLLKIRYIYTRKTISLL